MTAPDIATAVGQAFSDLECATRLNDDFVPIRLDRDWRPDADVRLQQAAGALGGARGWPLLICLTPTGAPFYATSYCEAENDPAQGLPGLRTQVYALTQTWRDDPAGLQAQAKDVDRALGKTLADKTAGPPPADLFERVAHGIQAELDHQSGGFASFGASAQFPAPRVLDLVCRHYARTQDPKSLDVVTTVLDAMLRGGI